MCTDELGAIDELRRQAHVLLYGGRGLWLGGGWEEEAGQGYCFGVAFAEGEVATVGARAGWQLDGWRWLWDMARCIVHRRCLRKWR